MAWTPLWLNLLREWGSEKLLSREELRENPKTGKKDLLV
jgi:hypothetical protein